MTPGTRSICAMTSSEPAIGGIAFGETKDAASMRRRPVRLSASMSRTRSATGTGASFCSPSRGPTSQISTVSGRRNIGPPGYSPRRRTRILTGVGPNENTSRIVRST